MWEAPLRGRGAGGFPTVGICPPVISWMAWVPSAEGVVAQGLFKG